MPRWFKFDPLPSSPPNPRSRPIPIDHDPTHDELLATDNFYHLIGLQDPALQGADAPVRQDRVPAHERVADVGTPGSEIEIGPLGSYDPILSPNRTTLENPVLGGRLRVSDPMGQGHFGAPRKGKPQGHEGIDIVAAPGAVVHSAVDGVVLEIGKAYKNKLSPDEPTYWIVDVMTTNGDTVRHMYVDPSVRPGDFVNAGQVIGSVQDLSLRHGKEMTNHTHVALRSPTWRPGGGKYVDPTDRMRWGRRLYSP